MKWYSRLCARIRTQIFILLAAPLMALSIPTLALEWPQEIEASEGKIIIYQPQPEQLVGNVLSGRAAMSLELKKTPEPIFGAFWFTAKLDTDSDAGTAVVRDIQVTKVNWPDSTEEHEARFTTIVESILPKTGLTISLEQLSASLKTAELEQKSLDGLNNDPPSIIIKNELSILLAYDGEPRFSPIDNSPYERALNTPFAVVRDKSKNAYYLSSGKLWYSAKSATGPWSITKNPPPDLVKMVPESEDPAPAKAPAVVVSTKPTELISTDGKPNWKSLPGGQLLYVENTETPWLRELTTGKMYVLLSGRWYQSGSEKGPWAFIRPDKLPASFKDIPPDSDIGGLRVSVAGTEEAEDAMLDAQIPQTTAVKRSEAKLEVTYDGSPKFEKIAGTSVSYAVNTGAQVLQIAGRYYAVDNGVWFTSAKATGPWAVADSIPKDEIAKIPPSSPVYNTTYVNVYESTPEVVYTGYTPGYLWSYPYYGVPVYGTGFYYPPYWGGGYYYPHTPTWGFHVGYNPWTGWNFGVSWSNGFFNFGMMWSNGGHGAYSPWGCCGGWYGGGYHNSPVFINNGNINIGNSVNIGNRTKINNKIGNTNLANNRKINNLYNRPENRARNADKALAHKNLTQARSIKRDNNIFADKSGAVARKVGNDWQVRDKGGWHASAPDLQDHAAQIKQHAPEIKQQMPEIKERIPQNTRDKINQLPQQNTNHQYTNHQYTRPSTRPQINRPDLNRANYARQSGAARAQMRGMNMRRGR
ncbi:carbohydrate-binding family V/XII [Cellvibrio sp. NN19]|uniref:carbohydrate-binding family V/XII n=1 Tax=Cellvibrio chitinivorans TaxID=3102792 RepID=UPI002B40C90E|nr:carbohydrate-binding family V/XII [Cellvibrio sp. NN19]